MNQKQMTADDIAVFLSSFRARHESISGDAYAKLWVTDEMKAWHDQALENFGAYEDIVHSIRNHFMLDRMTEFFNSCVSEEKGFYINLGAGISSYGLQLPENIEAIEVERPNIIDLKKNQFEKWANQGLIPKKQIHYLSCDLNDPKKIHNLEQELDRLVQGAPSFVVMEGLLYFLNVPSIERIFEMLYKIQPSKSQVGSVSFEPQVKNTPAYQRMEKGFDSDLEEKDSSYTFLEREFYQTRLGYDLLEATDYLESIDKMNLNSLVPSNNTQHIINESLYLLERK